ncbi:hypothetical protein B0A52_01506 [Exophiala mesophila]|uniref:Transcription factor domain-containing protein n=1 Tax=Exophiala mesophila TaxID=212818 RepID=A0A438NFA5_EXOME|nr:hypothetical protein B0A52_01506 [Exophiala mesophila]
MARFMPGLGEETSSEGLVSNQFAQVEGAFDQQPTVPRGRAKSPKHGSRNPSADAGSAQNWDQDWDQDWDQENRLTQTESRPDEPRSLKIAEYVERTEMFAEAIELRNALAMVRSGVLTKPAYALTQTSTPSLHRAVEYFMQVLVPNNTPVYTIFQVTNVNCMYFLQVVESRPLPHLVHSVLALLHLHTGAAISHIRKLISEQGVWNDDAVILSVVCLASFARAMGDSAAYNLHRAKLALMIEARGGLQNTGHNGLIKSMVRQFAPPASIPLAICFDQESSLEPDEKLESKDSFFNEIRPSISDMAPELPLSAELSESIRPLPVGFQCLVLQAKLSIKTIELLCRIETALKESPEVQAQKYQNQSPMTGGWQQARYSDFWECCPSISRPGADPEKLLCLSLLLYTANEVGPERAGHKGLALYGGPRAVLAAEIGMLTRHKLTPYQRHCWMWIWWVLIDSWHQENDTTETGTLLVSQFWATFPEIRGWSGLERTLQRFFWGGKFEIAVRRLAKAPAADTHKST